MVETAILNCDLCGCEIPLDDEEWLTFPEDKAPSLLCKECYEATKMEEEE